ncbi:MAG: helix-turn-helix domain-containing protein [Blautia sp.]
MEADKHNIPKRLAMYRHKLGKSQEEMSKELGVNQSHYSKMENGTKYISYRSLKKFEENGGDVNYLITGIPYRTGIVEVCTDRCRTERGKTELIKTLLWITRQGTILAYGDDWNEENRKIWKYIRLAEQRNTKETIWKNIRGLEHLTQAQMAEGLKMNIKRYQRLEKLEVDPDADILNSLYFLYGYSPLVILDENTYYIDEINKSWEGFPEVVKTHLNAVLEENIKLISMYEER